MRLKLVLEPISPRPSISLNYQYLFAAMLYHVLSNSSSEYAHFLHNEGYRSGNKKFKYFTFSRPKTISQRVEQGRIFFNGIVNFFISSPVDDFLNNLLMGLLKIGEVSLADRESETHFRVREVSSIATPVIGTSMRFTCLTPITLAVKYEQHNGQMGKHYVAPDEANYAKLIKENLLEKYRTLYGNEPSDSELKFEYDWQYIERQGGVHKVSKLIDYKGIKIRGYLAPFTVSGSSELIKLGYECGFGNSNSQGFGMVEVVR